MDIEYRSNPNAPDLRLHARKCVICHHPQQAEIEEAFIHWDDPAEIVAKFGLSHRSLLYRHARAHNLYEGRAFYLRSALDHIIERAASTPVTAGSIVSAVHAYAHLNSQGKWVEPPRKVILAKDEPPDRDVQIVVDPSLYEAYRARREDIEKSKSENAQHNQEETTTEKGRS